MSVKRRETVIWNGTAYHRYPDSPSRACRFYFQGSRAGKARLLHRDVWEHFNGPIPEGHEIHHADLNVNNNDISNLECVTVAEHDRSWTEGHRHKVVERRRNRVASQTPAERLEILRACGLA